jgi:hypothetical protein
MEQAYSCLASKEIERLSWDPKVYPLVHNRNCIDCSHIIASSGKAIFKLCFASFRSITFEYAEEVEVHGMTGYRFELGKRLLDNGTIDRSNWCNCGGHCVPQGALNMSSCRHGAPAFVSFPHYLDADAYYASLVRGMNPDPSRHRFYMTFEPVSGLWANCTF